MSLAAQRQFADAAADAGGISSRARARVKPPTPVTGDSALVYGLLGDVYTDHGCSFDKAGEAYDKLAFSIMD